MKFLINKLSALPSVLLIILLMFSSFSYAENSVIGKVLHSDGNNTKKSTDQTSSALKENNFIRLADLLKTEEDSTLIVMLIDGAKVTLRPNTTLYIKQYDTTEAKLSLVKGGIRVVTGKIAKQNPDLFKVITSDGIVTAQQKKSDFTVRICTQDCNQENEKVKDPKRKNNLPVVAKIVALQGYVEVASNNKRRLKVGSVIYNNEELESADNSYAQLQFRDGSSATVQAESALLINDYKFNETGHEDRSVFSLLKGGLRFLTGLMGKKDRNTFRLNTAVATIGIRGTDFSVNCVGSCNSGGVVSYVTQGSIIQQNDSGSYIVSSGAYSFISTPRSVPTITTTSPVNFDNNIAPPPSDSQLNTESLFTTTNEDAVEPGTHVSVEDGQVGLVGPSDDTPVLIDSNLTASVEPTGTISNVSGLNAFQEIDPFFSTLMSAPVPVVNTIVVGTGVLGSTTDSVSSASGGITSVIQEQTITSPY